MHITNEYLLIAKDISTDVNDNMVSILKIIDDLNISINEDAQKQLKSAPLVFPATYVIATSWRADKKLEKDYPVRLRIKLVGAAEEQLSEMLQEAVFTKGTDKLRFNIGTQGIPISQPGKYTFEVTCLDTNDEALAKSATSINVNIKLEK